MDKAIEQDSNCFCCGIGNEKGLHLVFDYPSADEAETSLVVPEYFSGWKRITHGGFLSMLLDEAMAHACLAVSRSAVRRSASATAPTGEASSAPAGEDSAVTGEITVRFLAPVETGSRVRVVGKVVQRKGRILSTEGQVYDEKGEVAVRASARFIASKRQAG